MKVTPKFFKGSVTQKLGFTVEFYGNSGHGYEVLVVKPDGSPLYWDADQDLDNLLLELATALQARLDKP